MDTQSDTGVVQSWLKVNLGNKHCVEKVIVHIKVWSDTHHNYWTCTQQDCNNCNGLYCEVYIVTVNMEEAGQTPPPLSHCKYGDTAKIEKTKSYTDLSLSVKEMAVIGKQCKS